MSQFKIQLFNQLLSGGVLFGQIYDITKFVSQWVVMLFSECSPKDNQLSNDEMKNRIWAMAFLYKSFCVRYDQYQMNKGVTTFIFSFYSQSATELQNRDFDFAANYEITFNHNTKTKQMYVELVPYDTEFMRTWRYVVKNNPEAKLKDDAHWRALDKLEVETHVFYDYSAEPGPDLYTNS